MINFVKMQDVYRKKIALLERKNDVFGVTVFNYVAAKMGVIESISIEEISKVDEKDVSENLCNSLTALMKCIPLRDRDEFYTLIRGMGFVILAHKVVTTEEEAERARERVVQALKEYLSGPNPIAL